jgi:type II secretory pathway component PulF
MSQLAFQYHAIDRRGSKTKGVLRAESQNDAYRQVIAAGMQPVKIAEVRQRRGRGRRITVKDLSHLTYQLSVLMEARIPIIDGLRSIADQENNPRFKHVINDVAQRIESGQRVTEALSPHRELFGDVYVDTVRAAESSGNMTVVLASLAEMLDRQYEVNKNVKGALMYPICVVGALGLAVTFLMIFVVPKFATMFASRGVELPVPTKILIAFSDFLRTYWYVILAAMIGGVWGLKRACKRPTTRRRLDTALHKVPFLRDVLKGLAVSRFAHVLGISAKSGLGLIDAIEMAGRASGRPLLMLDAQKMQDQVKHGGRLSDVLLDCNYLPPFTRRMMAAGEESAELSKMCGIVARHYDREVAHLTKNVTTVIEPILIVGLAGIVLLVALAIFLPMWNMASLI